MIIKSVNGETTHFFSDEGKKIRMKGSKRTFNNAYEKVGEEHEWEEVEDDE